MLRPYKAIAAICSLRLFRNKQASQKENSDDAGFGGSEGGAQQQMDALRHRGKAFVVGQALVIAIVNLLNDHRDFETRENQVEGHVGYITAGFFRVTLDELGTGQTAGIGRRPPTRFEYFRRIARIDPIGQCGT